MILFGDYSANLSPILKLPGHPSLLYIGTRSSSIDSAGRWGEYTNLLLPPSLHSPAHKTLNVVKGADIGQYRKGPKIRGTVKTGGTVFIAKKANKGLQKTIYYDLMVKYRFSLLKGQCYEVDIFLKAQHFCVCAYGF